MSDQLGATRKSLLDGASDVRMQLLGEVRGLGYEAGGRPIEWWLQEEGPEGIAVIKFNDVTWPVATLEARAALIYDAGKAERPALAILDFGQWVRSTNGPFVVEGTTIRVKL